MSSSPPCRPRVRPVVVIGTLPPSVDVDNVRANSPAGVGLALAHLVATGRRRIAFVNGPVDTVPGSARLAGYLAALRRARAADLRRAAGRGGGLHLRRRRASDRAAARPVDAGRHRLRQRPPRRRRAQRAAPPRHRRARRHRHRRDGRHRYRLLVSPTLTSVDLGSARRAAAAARLLLERLADSRAASEARDRRAVV